MKYLTDKERDILRWATDNGDMPQPGTEAYDEMKAAVERVPELLGTINRMRALMKEAVGNVSDKEWDLIEKAMKKELSDNPPAGEIVVPIPADRYVQHRRVVTGPDWVELITELKPVNLSVSDVAKAVLAFEAAVEPYSVTETSKDFYGRMLDHVIGTPENREGETTEHNVVIVDSYLSRHEVPFDVMKDATLLIGIRPDGHPVVVKDRYGLFPNGIVGKTMRRAVNPIMPRKGTGKSDDDYRVAEPLKALRKAARKLNRVKKADVALRGYWNEQELGDAFRIDEPFSDNVRELIEDIHREAGEILLEERGGILMGYVTGFETMEDERNQFIAAFTFAAQRGMFAPHHLQALVRRYGIIKEYAPQMGLQS